MKYAEVARKFRALGCEKIPRRGKGSHRKWRNPATGQATILPNWGRKDLKIGTIRAVVRQLGLEWNSFKDA